MEESALYSSFWSTLLNGWSTSSLLLNWKVIAKVDPTPGSEVSFISPLNLLTIYSAMTKPKPIPLVFI